MAYLTAACSASVTVGKMVNWLVVLMAEDLVAWLEYVWVYNKAAHLAFSMVVRSVLQMVGCLDYPKMVVNWGLR